MIKIKFDVFIIVLILLLVSTTSEAQLFENRELYPGTKIIKGKYYNGTGVGKYWSLYYVDDAGRVIKKESYQNKQLMSRHEIVYDDHSNKIFVIQTFDYNNQDRIDTVKYAYKYTGNRIIFQLRELSANDSMVIELIESHGDSLLMYQEKAFYYRPKTKTTDVYETIYTLRYRNGMLVSREKFDMVKNVREIIKYDYLENDRQRHRVIETIPEPEYKGVYTGGPGSDDEYYKYKLDSKGRILKYYRIIEGRKFKVAVYRYK